MTENWVVVVRGRDVGSVHYVDQDEAERIAWAATEHGGHFKQDLVDGPREQTADEQLSPQDRDMARGFVRGPDGLVPPPEHR